MPVRRRGGNGRHRDRLAGVGRASGKGRVEYTTLPAETMLADRHRGPYEQLDGSYRALQALVESEGLSVNGSPREIYWTDPDELPEPADWVTEIQFPIARDEARIAALSADT